MYVKKSVIKFLEDQKIKPEVTEAVQKRMDEVEGSIFVSSLLNYIIGDRELTNIYTEACEKNPNILLFGIPN